MADWFPLVEKKALRVIPGGAYNAYRTETEQKGVQPDLFYEIVLKRDERWEALRDGVYPAFARYLKSKSVDPERAAGIVVSLFVGERCFLLDGGAFLEIFKTVEGLNDAAFHFRVLSWLS